MSSLKMTFSLTSLILIFALVAAMPVLAHDLVDDETGDQHVAGTDISNHEAHPVVKSVTLLGDAADGYVGQDSFEVDITFEAKTTLSTNNTISLPTDIANIALEASAGTLTLIGPLKQRSTTVYRGRYTLTGTSGAEITLSVADGSENIFSPAAPDTGDDPVRVMVTLDTLAPMISTGELQALPGKVLPLDGKLTEAFDVVFSITDDATQDEADGMLDGNSFDLMADPAELTFSNKRWLGGNKYGATATPKAVTADETATTSVTITATIEDMADNEGTGTAMATLAPRMAADDDDGMDDADPPTATITIVGMGRVGVHGLFNVRVVFVPATGGSDVTGFDHTKLTIMDSSTPARTVSVKPASELTLPENMTPFPNPLKAANLYDGVLSFDVRHDFTYPLKVTIDQTAQKTHNPMESADVGTAAPVEPPEDTRAVGSLAGPADGDLLSGEFQVSITFSKATTLSEDDIVIEPTGAGHVTAGSISPATGSATMFTVRIQPFAGAEMITVKIDTNERIVPHAMNGSIMDAAPIGTLTSITGPDEFDGTDPFVVELTFEEALPTGKMLEDDDLEVTNGSVTAVGAKLGSDTVYEVQITPDDDTADVVVGLSDAGMARFTYTGDPLTVMQEAEPGTPGDVTASLSDDGMTTTISEGLIGAHDFVVINSADLPDLEEFFDIGGTIDLDDGDAAADANLRNVVISEILWGLDLGATLIEDQKQWQFIELYNTTDQDIDLMGWMLKFSEGRPGTDAIDIDQVSNRPPLHVGWTVDIGRSGRVTSTRAVDPDATITAINIISMYRNIAYATVEKPDHDANATENRKKQLAGVPSGNDKGSWKASQRRDPNTPAGVGVSGAQAARWIYASRSEQHYTTTDILTKSSVARSPFVISEIGNGTGDTNDWVEIQNKDSADKSLKNYHLSIVTTVGTDNSLINFHDDNITVPGNGFIVLANTSPERTHLAAGRNAAVEADDQVLTGVDSVYYVDGGLKLPDDGKFNLILRNAHDKLKASSHFMDVVGGQVYKDVSKATNLWPLVAAGAPHGDVIDGQGRDLKAGYVYKRNNQTEFGATGEHHLARAGYTGIGYDRAAAKSDANGGTPGFANDASKDKIAGLTTGDITISEVMVDVGEGRQNLPQWIELHNSSMTQAVNLKDWKLHIENAANGDGTLETNTFSATLTLGDVTISPNQTVLIASSTGKISDPDHFPSTRVINLWTTRAHRDALEMTRRSDAVLSTTGFNITLADKDNMEVDSAGNLDGNRRTRDEIAWALPMGEDDGRRSSMIRRYDEGVAIKGTMKEAWISADATNLAYAISHTFYGDADDFGTPGFRGGGPLPVSLSKFRPERLDTGEVIVRWITESELNNAGFNILRSETRNGEFTKVHYVAGKGTTTERSLYEWKDTSAKPNVVYYYQIQDVSLDGKITTLRQSRLKGDISADGKLTVTWGELKALQ